LNHTQPTADAMAGMLRIRVTFLVQLKDFLGTKLLADAASLAPSLVHPDERRFLFTH
jgi:hypothetical protein